MPTDSSPVRTSALFGGVMAFVLGTLLASLPSTTHLILPSPLTQAAALGLTSVVSAGIGAALALQTPHEDEGDRAGVDAVLAGLLSMGLLTLGGMLVVGQSDGLFFAASAGSASIALLAWVYKRFNAHPVALVGYAGLAIVGWTGLTRLLF